jgi:hypothetical protein
MMEATGVRLSVGDGDTLKIRLNTKQLPPNRPSDLINDDKIE